MKLLAGAANRQLGLVEKRPIAPDRGRYHEHRARAVSRDTFASQLVTCGVPIGYVSKQLGHAGIEITSKHYAKWAGGDDYREPLRRKPGEVPADFLARLPRAESHQSPIVLGRKSA